MAIIDTGYQADGTPHSYTSLASAISAASTGDTVRLWYSNTVKNTYWYLAVTVVNKAVTIEGGLAGRRISVGAAANLFLLRDDVQFNNLSIVAAGIGLYLQESYPNITVTIRNCFFSTGGNGVYQNEASQIVYCLNNHMQSVGGRCVALSNGTAYVYNNVFYSSRIGVDISGSSIATVSNNVFYSCGTDLMGSVSGANNADQQNQVPATGRIDLNAINPEFLLTNLDDLYPNDFRITKYSDLVDAGVDVGLSSDIDGHPYSSGAFPVGCSAGLDYIDEMTTDIDGRYYKVEVSNVKIGINFGTNNEDTGTYDPSGQLAEVADISFTDRRDGTGTDASVSNIDPIATINSLYYRKLNTTTWILVDTFTEDGIINIDLGTGYYEYKITATSPAGTNCDGGSFTVTDTEGYNTGQYRVTKIVSMPGSPYKRLMLEKIDRPIHP